MCFILFFAPLRLGENPKNTQIDLRKNVTQERMAKLGQRTVTENEIGKIVVDSAIKVHRELGPGLLESVYEAVMAHELQHAGLEVQRQVAIPIRYRDLVFEEGFRADMIVASKVILELKSVESLINSHKKQLLTYLKLTQLKLGFLLNFSESLMKNGIIRIVNGL